MLLSLLDCVAPVSSSTPFTRMLLTEVLLPPLTVMVVVIVEASRRLVKTALPVAEPNALLHSS